MARLARIMVVAALALGCRTPPTADARPPPPAIDAGPSDAAAAPVDAAAPVTATACAAYVDHVLALALTAMRGTRAPDELPTPEQVAGIRAGLIADAPCAALTAAELTCAMAAQDQAALYACARPPAP